MTEEGSPVRTAALRILSATTIATAYAVGVYEAIETLYPADGAAGIVGFAFLLTLPSASCAFVAYVADPLKTRTYRTYVLIPVWMLLAVIVAAIFVEKEGALCIVLLSPFWLFFGWLGVHLTWRLRRLTGKGHTYSFTMLALPLIAMQIEPHIPVPRDTTTVERSIVVDASPEAIWPLLRGIPHVGPHEGRWTITQDLIGVPRPVGAHLEGDGVGADRYAVWERNIRFRERIEDWEVNRRMGWRFFFDDVSAWRYTDRHLMPGNPWFTVTTGGYRADPLPDGRTRVSLHTEYEIQTPFNAWSMLCGQLLLGDLENNILAVIKGRAEGDRMIHR
jgi:hypothetical protein